MKGNRMFGIAKRMFRDKKNALLAYTFSIVVFLEMYLALFPSIQASAAQLEQLLQAYPDSFFKAFGIDKADLTYRTVEPYLASEIFSFFWPIIVVIMMTALANYAIVGEIGKGTIELTLSQPISRLKLFFSRYLSGMLNLGIFTAVTIYAIIPLATIHNIDYNLTKFSKMGIVAFLFGLAVFSLSMLFSSIYSDKGKASASIGGIVILMYALNVVSALKENLDKLKYFSFFHYYAPGTVLSKGEFIDWTFPVFIGVAIVATALAAFIFNKRDIAT